MTNAKPKTIDEYFAALSDDKRAALERLRKIIRAAAPRAKSASATSSPPSASAEERLSGLAQARITAPSTAYPKPTRTSSRITTPAEEAPFVFSRPILYWLPWYGSW